MSDKLPRPDQTPPSWKIWGMSAGRGAGKTFAAIHWINEYASTTRHQRIVIMVPEGDDIAVMAEKFTSDFPEVVWEPKIRRLTWLDSMSIAFITDGQNPYGLRGLQSHLTYMDNVQHFAVDGPDHYDGGYSRINMMDAARTMTRLGPNPRFIITHTPDYEKIEGAIYTMDQQLS